MNMYRCVEAKTLGIATIPLKRVITGGRKVVIAVKNRQDVHIDDWREISDVQGNNLNEQNTTFTTYHMGAEVCVQSYTYTYRQRYCEHVHWAVTAFKDKNSYNCGSLSITWYAMETSPLYENCMNSTTHRGKLIHIHQKCIWISVCLWNV